MPSSRRAVLSGFAAATLAGVAGCTSRTPTSQSTTLPSPSGTVLALLASGAAHPPGTSTLAQAITALGHDIQVREFTRHDEQVSALRAAKDEGVGLALVQAVDPARLRVDDASVPMVTLGRILKKSEGLRAHVGFDEFGSGEKEIAALSDHLHGSTPPHHVELVPLGPDDENARSRFDGNVFTLNHLAGLGTMLVKSGQNSYDPLATDDRARVARRLQTTYRVTYTRTTLDAVVIPDSSYAELITQVARAAKRPVPLLLTSGASEADVKSLRQGTTFSTQYRDPAALAAALGQVLDAITRGDELEFTPLYSRRNRLKSVPTRLVTPTLVTRANAATVLAGNEVLGPLIKG